MSCSSLPQLKQDKASQPWTFSTLVSPVWGTIVQLSIVEILGVPSPSNFLPVDVTGALTFCPLAAVVIHIFSFGKQQLCRNEV